MSKLLHIIATPRAESSRTLKVSESFIQEFENDNNWEIDTLNLFTSKIPEITHQNVAGKYELLLGKDLDKDMKVAWQKIVAEIDRFKNADAYLISTPMWNFSIPYELKHYLDIIVQPKYLFKYTADGKVEGLIKAKPMTIITSRGGDYSTPETTNMDLQEPYLRTIFNFIGITDLTFIHAQPMDALGEEIQQQRIAKAQEEAKALALKLLA